MSQDLVNQLSAALKAKGLTLAAAESCTGGLLSSMITSQAGASAIFDRAFITYSNAAKIQSLGVPAATIDTHGAVSAQTAEAMAAAALKHSTADIAISITGIAGPDGGTPDKPVGLVYIGIATKNTDATSTKHIFTGSRSNIQQQAANAALQTISDAIT